MHAEKKTNRDDTHDSFGWDDELPLSDSDGEDAAKEWEEPNPDEKAGKPGYPTESLVSD